MKKAFIYSAIVLLAAGTACNKTDSVLPGDGQIRFALSAPETRSLVENVTDLQNNQTIKVFDFLLDGTNYFDADETVKYDASEWKFQTGKGYTWKSGKHKFFAYTNGAGNFADNKLTVAKTLTTAEANQVDLVYSNIVSKTAEQAKEDSYMPVSLNMDHLFAAVSITLKNCTDYEASVTKVTAPVIPNEGSATVSYAGNAADVTYTTPTVSTSSSFVSATPINAATAMPSQKSIDVLKMAAADAKAYQLVWPQTLAEDAVTVTVSYTLNGTTYTDKTVTLPADTWVAGQKYDYELQILPSDIRLVFVVQPWDSGEAGDIDTKNGSINMSNVTWMNTKLMVNDELVNTVVNKDFSVTMYKDPYVQSGDSWTQYSGYYPAQGYFTVNYPKAGLFKIELKPAVKDPQGEYFDASKYEILIYDASLATPAFRPIETNGETITINTVYFRITAADNQDGAQHKAQINILFKPDGSDEWISAYSEIRANYALVIPATN